MSTQLTLPRLNLSNWFARRPVTRLRDDMGEMVERLWNDVSDGWTPTIIGPPVDLSETDTEIRIRMDLPGVKANEVDVQLSGNHLIISGHREEKTEEKGETFHRIERLEGKFSRSILLPAAVQDEKIAAKYEDGVLCVTMPKTEQAKSKRIEIKTK